MQNLRKIGLVGEPASLSYYCGLVKAACPDAASQEGNFLKIVQLEEIESSFDCLDFPLLAVPLNGYRTRRLMDRVNLDRDVRKIVRFLVRNNIEALAFSDELFYEMVYAVNDLLSESKKVPKVHLITPCDVIINECQKHNWHKIGLMGAHAIVEKELTLKLPLVKAGLALFTPLPPSLSVIDRVIEHELNGDSVAEPYYGYLVDILKDLALPQKNVVFLCDYRLGRTFSGDHEMENNSEKCVITTISVYHDTILNTTNLLE